MMAQKAEGDEMFRISFLVRDKHLPEVLKLLDASKKVVGLEPPRWVTLPKDEPATEAKPKGYQKAAVETLIAALPQEFERRELLEQADQLHGLGKMSVDRALTNLVKQGSLRRTGKGRYVKTRKLVEAA